MHLLGPQENCCFAHLSGTGEHDQPQHFCQMTCVITHHNVLVLVKNWDQTHCASCGLSVLAFLWVQSQVKGGVQCVAVKCRPLVPSIPAMTHCEVCLHICPSLESKVRWIQKMWHHLKATFEDIADSIVDANCLALLFVTQKCCMDFSGRNGNEDRQE